MGFKSIIVTKPAKLSYKNGYMIIRTDITTMVHISEIELILLDTLTVTLTGYLLNELITNKVKIVFSDNQHNPLGEIVPYYGAHNSSKRIRLQINWCEDFKQHIWMNIIKSKITNQMNVLLTNKKSESLLLQKYISEVQVGDKTNREGHAAKVYFNSLFGNDFNREQTNNVNAALDYGYAIILSSMNKYIVSKGYITNIGINHKNEFNHFNLGCDLMEPFRCFVDSLVYKNKQRIFDKDYRIDLVNILNKKVRYMKKVYHLSNCIELFIHNISDCLNSCIITDDSIFYIYEV